MKDIIETIKGLVNSLHAKAEKSAFIGAAISGLNHAKDALQGEINRGSGATDGASGGGASGGASVPASQVPASDGTASLPPKAKAG